LSPVQVVVAGAMLGYSIYARVMRPVSGTAYWILARDRKNKRGFRPGVPVRAVL